MPTGSDQQTQIARMRAVAIAKHQLKNVPNRPEELEGQANLRISIQSGGHGQIRVRLQRGREWINTQDFQVEPHRDGPASQTGWCAPFLAYIGKHLNSYKIPLS